MNDLQLIFHICIFSLLDFIAVDARKFDGGAHHACPRVE
jgi:hypothetical protein